MRLAEPRPLKDVLAELGIPLGEIAVTVLNGVAVDLESASASDGDHVELFPPVGGGK